jgi:hypothetical protein
MINFPYTYKVVNVYPEYGTIEVEYSAEGFETILRGMAIPAKEVDFHAYVKLQAPEVEWVVNKAEKHNILVGVWGTYNPAENPPTPNPLESEANLLGIPPSAEEIERMMKLVQAV